jgi:hypothetical protein
MKTICLMVALVLSLVTAPSAIAAQPGEGEEWVARANDLFRAERYKESIAAYQRSMQLRAPRAHESAWHIARAYARLGNAKQARRWLMHARQLGFDDESAIAADPEIRALPQPERRSRKGWDVRGSCAACRTEQVSRAA